MDSITLYLFDIDSNKIIVKTQKPLINKKVKIELINPYIKNKINIIYKNGKKQDRIFNLYGTYTFIVIYDDKYYAKITHYRFNWHDQYHYIFKLKKEKNNIFLDTRINGANSQSYYEKMSKNHNCKEL